MKLIRTLSVIIALLLITLAFTACKKPVKETAVIETPPAAVIKEPENVPAEPVLSTVLNPVTGTPVPIGKEKIRPVAIMINNLKVALPHEGIGAADIYFELPTEGATNRIMAVFYNYASVWSIGPVRSARDYYVDYALPLDAVFLHYGGSPQYYALTKAVKFDHLDGINGTVDRLLYWRDAGRKSKSGTEHSVMTKGANILDALPKFQIKTELEAEYVPYFHFSAEEATAGTISALSAKIPFSHYIAPLFTYDDKTKTYLRSEYDAPHIDNTTKGQIAVKNVVVLKTSVKQITGDTSLRLEVETSGSGTGYYISGGTARKIIWKKESQAAPLKLFTENAKDEIAINVGKTWICVLDSNPRFE